MKSHLTAVNFLRQNTFTGCSAKMSEWWVTKDSKSLFTWAPNDWFLMWRWPGNQKHQVLQRSTTLSVNCQNTMGLFTQTRPSFRKCLNSSGQIFSCPEKPSSVSHFKSKVFRSGRSVFQIKVSSNRISLLRLCCPFSSKQQLQSSHVRSGGTS